MGIYRRRYEFSAHKGNVNCLRLGRASGVALVTGGDDNKVNMWRLGHSHPVVSLSSDSSPIDCVSFDTSDEYVVSGNRHGCVTLWDIPKEKVGRQFMGHQDRVTSVEYHPSKGYYIVSGSADSVVKMWDVRRKSCLHSFKGTTKQVTCTSFSPDGKWICSGFADGEIKLWDIRTRKLLESFRQHRGWISGLEFHPTECLMATASHDGSIRLWDLESSETVEKIGPESKEVRCIQFSADGDCLLSALPDGLQSHGWEPYQLYDSTFIQWTHVCDMAISHAQKKLVVCTRDQSRVGVWLVDLKKLHPFLTKEKKLKESEGKKRTGEMIPELKMDPVFDMRDSDSSARTTTSGRYSDKYSAFSTERSGKTHFTNPAESDRLRNKTLTERSSSTKSQSRTPHKLDLSELQRPFVPQLPMDPSPVNHTSYNQPHERVAMTSRAYADKKHLKPRECDRYSLKTERHMTKRDGSYTSRDINIEAFLPKKQQPIALEMPGVEPDDTECIEDMMAKKDMVRHILSSRVCNLQIIRRFWEQGNMKETLKAVQRCENPSVTVDFMGAVSPPQKILTLELIPCLIPLLLELLQSSHEKYWETALRVLSLVLKGLGGLIRETINGANMSMGVNISLEQRLEKCKNAQDSLLETLPFVERLSKLNGSVAGVAKDVQCRLSDLTT